MKKILIGVGVVLLVFFGWNYFKPSSVGERSDGGSNSSPIINKATATSTPTYFTVGTTASSTKIISTEVFGKMALNVCLTASTTASVFNWTVEQADDTTAIGTTWFSKRDFTETSTTLRTWGNALVYNTWTPANATASTTCAQLYDNDDFMGIRTRVTYNLTGANGAVFLETMIK